MVTDVAKVCLNKEYIKHLLLLQTNQDSVVSTGPKYIKFPYIGGNPTDGANMLDLVNGHFFHAPTVSMALTNLFPTK